MLFNRHTLSGSANLLRQTRTDLGLTMGDAALTVAGKV
jgi:hypothetical protein